MNGRDPNIDYHDLERTLAYSPESDPGRSSYQRFLLDSGNEGFRRSIMTWISLGMLALFYPGISLAFVVDPSELAAMMNDGMRLVTLISTIVMQWAIFLILYVAVFREKTGLKGIGLHNFRAVHIGWAVAFLLASNLILSGLAWVLAQVGLPMPGEIIMLVPQDGFGRVIWVLVSFTAGFCEEIAFRGYLMSRLRILSKAPNWIAPTIVSAVVFGACHAYQGIPGFIVITVYGALFSWLYIRTRSLWPGIIAHSLQDLGALFYPQ